MLSAINRTLRSSVRLTNAFVKTINTPKIACASFSTTKVDQVGQSPNPQSSIYEFRTYTVKPKDVKTFIEGCKNCMPTRIEHSPLLGYWMCELGALNTFIHVWQYESLSQRANVRFKLAHDPSWQEKSKFIFDVMDTQDNVLCQLCDWSDVKTSVDVQGGMYKLLRVQMKPSSPWNQTFKEYIQSRQDAFGDVMGAWWAVVGPRPTVYALFHHQHIDYVISGKDAPKEKVDRLEKAGAVLESQARHIHNFLMTPCDWSPLK